MHSKIYLAIAAAAVLGLAFACGDDEGNERGGLAGNVGKGGDDGRGGDGTGGTDGGGGTIGGGGAIGGGGTGDGGTTGGGGAGDGGAGGEPAIKGLDCGSGTCQCSDGVDNDEDGLIDIEDPECSGPYDNDEASFATGIPGDNKGSKAGEECFFDGDSGKGNDAQCAQYAPNGCDCFGCCVIDLNGNGSAETVGLFSPGCRTTRTPGAAEGTEGGPCFGDGSCNDGLNCIADGDEATSFCSACVSCEQDQECINPCEEGELCFGEEPGTSTGGSGGGEGGAGGEPDHSCPDGSAVCIDHADCPGVSEFCVTGCCHVFG